jgi:hypothetical protein
MSNGPAIASRPDLMEHSMNPPSRGAARHEGSVRSVLGALERADCRPRRVGSGWQALCPAHDDRRPSLSISEGREGRALLKCMTGCETATVLKALGLDWGDLQPAAGGCGSPLGCRGEGGSMPPSARATVQPGGGCTLAAYAVAKTLPEGFLRDLGLADTSFLGAPAVRMPYLDELGAEVAVRFRLELAKGDAADRRFRWRKGDKPCLYGLWRLQEARAAGHVVLVEGESDAQTLWSHGVPALGLPGAGNWREDWTSALEGLATIYVVIEPDRGGETVRAWLGRSRIRDRARLVALEGAKDPSELHVHDPAAFGEEWGLALSNAVSWTDQAAEEEVALKQAAWKQCADLASSPSILECLAEVLPTAGLVGEERAAKLVYLCATSRFLKRPVSAVVKGPSSAGKSFVTERTLAFFPASAYHALTAMSERSLAYSEEPLKHRMLVLYEAPGMGSDLASYLMRSLLSEGRVRYETVEKTSKGLQPRLIEREGPTGLLVTTTRIRLDGELETRLLSIPVNDSPEQTRRVLMALASGQNPQLDPGPWHALQEWLGLSEHRVAIPFAPDLGRSVPAIAVRLRRDFSALLNLIRAHALLHQASRERDEQGQVVATLDDYAVVRGLVHDLITEGVGAAVPPAVRDTVNAVSEMNEPAGVTAVAVGRRLRLDKSSASRRLRDAGERGYLTNIEQRRGQPGKWVVAESMPAELDVLPLPSTLQGGCAVVRAPRENTPPPSLDTGDVEAVVAWVAGAAS